MAALHSEITGILAEITAKIGKLNEAPPAHSRHIIAAIEEAAKEIQAALRNPHQSHD